MADIEEPQFTTLAERIAALNKQRNFQAPEPKSKRAPPPPPPTKAAVSETRSQTFPVAPVAPVDTFTNGSSATGRPTPSVPPRPVRAPAPDLVAGRPPPLPRRTTDSIEPQTQGQNGTDARGITPSPQPISRTATLPPPAVSSPALPPRRPSAHPSSQYLSARRNSNASEVSTLSSTSLNNNTVSSATSIHSLDGPGRKLPPAFDPASLPPLPPSKRERDAQAKEAAAAVRETAKPRTILQPVKSTPVVRQIEAPQRPSLPPRMTNSSVKQQQQAQQQQQPVSKPAIEPAAAPTKPQLPRRLPPPTIPVITHQLHQPAPAANDHHPAAPVKEAPRARPPVSAPLPIRNASPSPGPTPIPVEPRDDDAPPPIPISSRPTAAQVDAVTVAAARPTPIPQPANECLICRDFSVPDAVAAQHPRENLPRNDPVGHLANVLCSPFTSYTDKARAIFTWFHHNIAYDCAAFFGNNVRARGAEETISMGRAVCSGYADTYQAIANRAGLECVVISGHGKGYGYTALKKGERPPPKKADGHAWNAVRIDGGEWKLLDACWGAGNVSGVTKQYTPAFKPHQFTRENEVFGMSHFPKNEAHFFRADGRVPTWEEYFIGRVHGETPTVYGHAHEEGILEHSIVPAEKQISVYSGETVRFQFSKLCEHWTSEKHGLGKPPLLMLSITGRDGRKKDMRVLQTNGYWWWVDVEAVELGAPGESVSVVALTKFDGRDGRGITEKEFLAKKGRVGMAWAGVVKWDLV